MAGLSDQHGGREEAEIYFQNILDQHNSTLPNLFLNILGT